MAEVAEKLRSQESQTQFLEQARTDLLTQLRSLSGQMLDGSREALLKSTKETVSEPFAKEVLAETTRDLPQRSEGPVGGGEPAPDSGVCGLDRLLRFRRAGAYGHRLRATSMHYRRLMMHNERLL